ncbi:MAG: hypothetical protein CL758_08850 [Chloroflexi bacterium]|nr:hypothetical protein [Chloroflexota bacterium]|tara:strand:- start:1739 stop:3508 length:1770 start_codon:yes stop_codon:yes gene_type:complete
MKIGIPISEIISDTGEKRFEIPKFQRGFSWEKSNVEDFLNDLEERKTDRKAHYLGSIFLLKRTDNIFRVIDGQQRLTCIFLFWIAWRDILYSIKNFDSDQTTNIEEKINAIDKRLLTQDGNDHRLTLSLLNKSLFEKLYVISKPEEKIRRLSKNTEDETDENLINAYETIFKNQFEHIKKLVDERKISDATHVYNDFFESLRTLFYLDEHIVDNADDAFRIFKTLNDRGIPLAQTDLIKNHYFEKLDEKYKAFSDKRLESIDANWVQSRIKITDKTESDYSFEKFLEHFIYVEYEKESKSSELYKNFSNLLSDENNIISKNPEKFVDMMGEWANIFVDLRRPDNERKFNAETKKYLKLINNIKSENTYPCLMIGYKRLFQEKNYTDFQRLSEILFKFHVREKMISGSKESVIARVTNAISNNLRKKKSISEIIDDIKSDQDYTHNIRESCDLFKPKDKSLVKYILETHQNIPAPDGVEIEHIMPRNKKLWKNDIAKFLKLRTNENRDKKINQYHKKNLNLIGNQILLEKKLNIEAKNKIFSQKQKVYAKSKVSEAKKLSKQKKKQWTEKSIKQRQKEITKTLVELFELK